MRVDSALWPGNEQVRSRRTAELVCGYHLLNDAAEHDFICGFVSRERDSSPGLRCPYSLSGEWNFGH